MLNLTWMLNMCIGSYLSSNQAQASATSATSAITTSVFLNNANNTKKPVEVLRNTESQVAASNDVNKEHLVKQNAESTFATATVVVPSKNPFQEGLDIIENNPDIGKVKVDVREYEHTDKNGIYTSTTTTFNHNPQIFFPSDTCMAAAAAYYKNKYGIHIHIVCEVQAHKTYELIQQLNDGEQLGIIARSAQYVVHVTPLIISKQGEDIFIIVLDSIDDRPEFSYIIENFFKEKLINPDDKKNYHLILVDGDRQADSYSCRHDALIILKDALKKPDLLSYFRPCEQQVISDCYQSSEDDNFVFKAYSMQLPMFLFKTVQISSVLAKFTDEDKSTVLKTSKDGEVKTLQTHFNKHKSSVIVTRRKYIIYGNRKNPITNIYDEEVTTENKNWLINEFLRIKGFVKLPTLFKELDDGTGKIDTTKERLLLSKHFYADS